jgi:hypothetical protein
MRSLSCLKAEERKEDIIITGTQEGWTCVYPSLCLETTFTLHIKEFAKHVLL